MKLIVLEVTLINEFPRLLQLSESVPLPSQKFPLIVLLPQIREPEAVASLLILRNTFKGFVDHLQLPAVEGFSVVGKLFEVAFFDDSPRLKGLLGSGVEPPEEFALGEGLVLGLEVDGLDHLFLGLEGFEVPKIGVHHLGLLGFFLLGEIGVLSVDGVLFLLVDGVEDSGVESGVLGLGNRFLGSGDSFVFWRDVEVVVPVGEYLAALLDLVTSDVLGTHAFVSHLFYNN